MKNSTPAGQERESCAEDIVEHIGRHFGPVQDLALAEIMPVSGVSIHVCGGRAVDDPKILFTIGMSDRPQRVPTGQDEYKYTELFIRIPTDWPLAPESLANPEYFWPIRWLKEVACYPSLNDTWLGGDFAIISNNEPPEALGPGTQLTCMMLICEANDVNPIRCRDGRSVLLYSLFPLYTEERELEKTEGVQSLFERFSEYGISFTVDPHRVNVATGKAHQSSRNDSRP